MKKNPLAKEDNDQVYNKSGYTKNTRDEQQMCLKVNDKLNYRFSSVCKKKFINNFKQGTYVFYSRYNKQTAMLILNLLKNTYSSNQEWQYIFRTALGTGSVN